MSVTWEMKRESLRMSVYASLLAALMAAGAYLMIPIGPVPIVLQNIFILLAGLLLGWRWSLASVSLYLLTGIIGLPVFSGGGSGVGHLLGPTGGYLLGYLPAVAVVGLISGGYNNRSGWLRDLIAVLLGSLIVYLCGVFWLMQVTGMSLSAALTAGMIPFLPGDALKIAASLVIARYARRIIVKSSAKDPPNGRD